MGAVRVPRLARLPGRRRVDVAAVVAAARALVATAAAGTAAVSSVIDADYTDDDLRETPSEQMIGLSLIHI